jgi:hypothetical protein
MCCLSLAQTTQDYLKVVALACHRTDDVGPRLTSGRSQTMELTPVTISVNNWAVYVMVKIMARIFTIMVLFMVLECCTHGEPVCG